MASDVWKNADVIWFTTFGETVQFADKFITRMMCDCSESATPFMALLAKSP